ncbi:hypothetical protein MY7_3543 [Bacillus sp. CN2]|nr:hypothetical protein BCBMB205_37370 [Bacillus velezensis]ARZ60082.1 hypothetical protein BAGQ_3878 [Bacillus velezensis]EIF15179.1 hypothetical protein MY7_3543 [Bacillus sp. 5B6]GFR55158.1 hypothetical protein MY7_3543 [Bacillus sp. CN2]
MRDHFEVTEKLDAEFSEFEVLMSKSKRAINRIRLVIH